MAPPPLHPDNPTSGPRTAPATPAAEGGPPFGSTWNGMYYLVLGVLAGTIALFAYLSAVYK